MTQQLHRNRQPPPLESGDRLTRPEFERRYAGEHHRRAELIEGVVYVASPVRARQHGRPHGLLVGWLNAYCAATPGVDLLVDTTVRLDADNEPQPDALLRLEPECGGNSSLDADDYVVGAPELVAEIAASSAAYDLHVKRTAYRRNGAREYLVWQVYEQQFVWFQFAAEGDRQLAPNAEGIIRSQVFPGLWLPTAAFAAGDRAALFAAVQAGTATTEHQAWVARLQTGSG